MEMENLEDVVVSKVVAEEQQDVEHPEVHEEMEPVHEDAMVMEDRDVKEVEYMNVVVDAEEEQLAQEDVSGLED